MFLFWTDKLCFCFGPINISVFFGPINTKHQKEAKKGPISSTTVTVSTVHCVQYVQTIETALDLVMLPCIMQLMHHSQGSSKFKRG